MRERISYDIICKDTIHKAKIGDIFRYYGILSNGAVLVYKSLDKDGCFGSFRELKKDGNISKYSFTYFRTRLSDIRRERHPLTWDEINSRRL